MRRQVCLDFETASTQDLPKVGAWRYAEDPTTEIICLFWRIIGGSSGGWIPTSAEQDNRLLRELADDPDVLFIAHNAAFEKAIWRKMMVPLYGFPDVPNERWHDTMAVCAMKALPQKLEHVLRVLMLGEKDTVGSKLTRGLSKAKKDGSYDRSDPTLQRAYDYCASDVDVEVSLHKRVGWLSPDERRVWLLDQAINERGVLLDRPFVRAARQIVDRTIAPLSVEFKEITGTEFTKIAQVKAWAEGRGVWLPDLTKLTVAKVLGGSVDEEDLDDDGPEIDIGPLPDDVRRALYIRQLVGSASIKKLGAMERSVCANGSVYGTLQYHGASTGRWAGRLVNPQNLPVGSIKLDDEAPPMDLMVQAIMTGDPDYVQAVLGPPVETVLSALRYAIISRPGRLLAVGDFSGVEARIVLALAGQHDKTALMASGVDVYCDMAGDIYGHAISKKDFVERKIGKNTVLGCGFNMGWDKFRRRYAPHMSEEFCRGVIEAYRKVWAPKVPFLWYGLEDACVRAVRDGGAHEAYGVTYKVEGEWLTARLPSGRRLWYYGPYCRQEPVPWDQEKLKWVVHYHVQKSGRWQDVKSYGGLLTENVVQALARDLMVHAMFLCEREGLPVILTVHDEIVTEPEDWAAQETTIKQIMEERPQWAVTMQAPIAAETWVGDRYHK
jgi:DNA polymerase